MANAIAGVGTTFERWSGSAWQFIAEINAIEGPTMDKENIEVTALDTDGGYDEFITGFMEGGTLTLNMNFSRSGYELMKQDFEIDVARDYRITLPDDEDTTLEFEGLVIEIPLTMEAENQLTADVTIQVTGEVAIASAGAESESVPEESESRTYLDVINDGHTVAWYDASDDSTITKDADNYVSEWRDKLGSGHDLAVNPDEDSSGGQNPMHNAVTDTVYFGGDSQNLKTESFTWGQPCFVYYLGKFVTWKSNEGLFDGYDIDHRGCVICSGTEPTLVANAGGSSSSGNANLAKNTFGVIRVLFNGDNSLFQVNETTPVTGNFGPDGLNGFTLSALYTRTGSLQATVMEVILRDSADDVDTQKILYDYLAAKIV